MIEEHNPHSGPFEVLRCAECGQLDPGPRELCPACMSPRLERYQASGRGTLVSSTVIRRAPARFRAAAPYIVAVVDLEEGVRVTARLARDADISPGAPVMLDQIVEGIPYFTKEPR